MIRSQFKTPVDNRYFEDYEEGSVHEFGAIVVEEEEIISFARRYDPQVFHTDPVEATKTAFGGLVASGWHTAALAMRLIVDYYLSHVASLGSPGVDESALAQASASWRQAIFTSKHRGDSPIAYKTGPWHRQVPCGSDKPGSRGSYELERDEHASMPECSIDHADDYLILSSLLVARQRHINLQDYVRH